MRAEKIVRRLVAPCRDQVHATRLNAVFQAVDAITRVQRVTLTSIGRAIRAGCLPRHGIKKIDRLLGNLRLRRERHLLFGAILQQLVGNQRRVVVLVDWTQLHDDLWALVASIPFMGRSLPVLAHAHRKSEVGSRAAHDEFLRVLRKLFPKECQPVIVADGGFRSPFFHSCGRMGFVIRLRNDRSIATVGETRKVPFSALFATATDAPRCLGSALPYASSHDAEICRLVLSAAPPKAASRKRYADDYERKRACEPYLLATNLENDAAATIVAIYEKRMQIEETFRDSKSPRFGWGLAYAKTASVHRFDVLLLLLTIAFVATVLVGAAAEEQQLDRHLRASSAKRRVLSLFSVGSILFRVHRFAIHAQSVWKQLKRVREFNRALFPHVDSPRSQHRPVKLPLPHDLFCANCGWNGALYGWPA